MSYEKYGQGSRVLIAFHGYGQDRTDFSLLGEARGKEYTIYSFDLFFHGHSSWLARNESLSKREWSAIIGHFLATEQVERFSLVGYSLGGRFALTLLESFSEYVDELILIAPDGLAINFWYWFGSSTRVGSYLLRRFILYPYPLFALMRGAHRSKLINKSVFKFAQGHMKTRRKRYLVYCQWRCFRRIQPDRRFVIEACNRQAIRVKLYVGEYDRIIKIKDVLWLHKNLKNSELHSIQSGHNHLIPKVAKLLSSNVSLDETDDE